MQLFEPPAIRRSHASGTDAMSPALASAVLAAGGNELLYVALPTGPDAPAFAVTALARQLGEEAVRVVRDAMMESQSPSTWFEALFPRLRGRRLLVESARGTSSASSSEVRAVLGRDLAILKRLARHAVGVEHPRPCAAELWDAETVWRRVGGDVDRYALAAAHQVLVGQLPAPSVAGDTRRLAATLWKGLSAELRELVALLWSHDRPIAREDLVDLDLVSARTIEVAEDANLVETLRGYVVPTRGLDALRDLEPAGAVQARHERWARSFESLIARPGLQGVVATLEAHRHYAAIPRPVDALRLARFGVGVAMQMAIELSRAGQWDAASTTYEQIREIVRDAKLPREREARVRAYVCHYFHYNRYKAGAESLDATLDGYRASLDAWPDNALFLSRYVRALFHARRETEALNQVTLAWRRVQDVQESQRYLCDRTVHRLIERKLVIQAFAVLDCVPPACSDRAHTSRQLVERQARIGWTSARLWAPGLDGLDAGEPCEHRAEILEGVGPEPDGSLRCWRARVGSAERAGETALQALTRATRSAQFEHRARVWLRATSHLSSRQRAFEHPQYLAILAMGRDVVPDILRWIARDGGGHWDAALTKLTGERPDVDVNAPLSSLMKAWVEWGRGKSMLG